MIRAPHLAVQGLVLLLLAPGSSCRGGDSDAAATAAAAASADQGRARSPADAAIPLLAKRPAAGAVRPQGGHAGSPLAPNLPPGVAPIAADAGSEAGARLVQRVQFENWIRQLPPDTEGALWVGSLSKLFVSLKQLLKRPDLSAVKVWRPWVGAAELWQILLGLRAAAQAGQLGLGATRLAWSPHRRQLTIGLEPRLPSGEKRWVKAFVKAVASRLSARCRQKASHQGDLLRWSCRRRSKRLLEFQHRPGELRLSLGGPVAGSAQARVYAVPSFAKGGPASGLLWLLGSPELGAQAGARSGSIVAITLATSGVTLEGQVQLPGLSLLPTPAPLGGLEMNHAGLLLRAELAESATLLGPLELPAVIASLCPGCRADKAILAQLARLQGALGRQRGLFVRGVDAGLRWPGVWSASTRSALRGLEYAWVADLADEALARASLDQLVRGLLRRGVKRTELQTDAGDRRYQLYRGRRSAPSQRVLLGLHRGRFTIATSDALAGLVEGALPGRIGSPLVLKVSPGVLAQYAVGSNPDAGLRAPSSVWEALTQLAMLQGRASGQGRIRSWSLSLQPSDSEASEHFDLEASLLAPPLPTAHGAN